MDEQQTNKAYPKIIGNTWEPTDDTKPWLKYIDDWHCNINKTIDRISFAKTKQLNFIDKQILKALKELANMRDIVIKPADKNLGPVILTRRQYETMCMDHLSDTNTYETITNFDPNKCYNLLENILEQHNMRYIQYGNNSNKRQKRETQLARSICQLKNSPLLRQAYFYCNPKMHKTGLIKKGRPIVSSINSVTYHTSIYLHNILHIIMKYLNTTVPSSQAALLRMQNIQVHNNSLILCADVKSLYPSIPIEYGLSAVHRMLQMVTDKQLIKINIPLTMALLQWVLTNNYFTYNNTTYKQLTGTAMGTPVAPVYANIVLFWIDVECCKHKLPMYMRYLDDIYSIVNNEQQAVDTVATFNAQCPTLKLDDVTIGRSGVFLDIATSMQNDKLTTKVYQKTINKYLYLKPTTNHSKSVLKNFILEELKRYRLICSEEHDYKDMARLFINRLQARTYNTRYITTEMLPAIPKRNEIMARVFNKPSNDASGRSTTIIIMSQLIKYHLKRNGYSMKPVFQLSEALQNNFVFIKAYPKYDSLGLIFGTTNQKSVSQYIIRAKYPKTNLKSNDNKVGK
jgi:hypothetical protein